MLHRPRLQAQRLQSGRKTMARTTLPLIIGALALSIAPRLFADALRCDSSRYKATPGLTASVDGDLVVVTWLGQANLELRARYAIRGAQPVVHDLAVRKAAAPWTTLGRDLTPEYR